MTDAPGSSPPVARRANARLRYLLLALLALVGCGVGVYVLIRMDAVVYLAQFNAWLADVFIRRLGYAGVFALMFIESSFIPFPSEIVIPPAADLARRLETWTLWGVIGWGTAGSLAGALFNYALARYLGRPAVYGLVRRFGHWVHLSEAGYVRAERVFYRYGAVSTFIGRLIPGIRQLISIPAGLSRMPVVAFCLYTTLGAGGWVAVLAAAGYWFGAQPERLAEHLHTYSAWVVAGALALLAAYLLASWQRRRLTARLHPQEERSAHE